jgi:hypothetical protein
MIAAASQLQHKGIQPASSKTHIAAAKDLDLSNTKLVSGERLETDSNLFAHTRWGPCVTTD